jgi:hypothetical protein
MKISDEQVRRAVEYLHTAKEHPHMAHQRHTADSAEFIDRVADSLRQMPDVREDRVAHARLLVNGALPSSSELAEKLIGRILSDAIR